MFIAVQCLVVEGVNCKIQIQLQISIKYVYGYFSLSK